MTFLWFEIAKSGLTIRRCFCIIRLLEVRKRGRVVYCNGFENRRRVKPTVSSNPTASAINRKNSLTFLGEAVFLRPRLAAKYLEQKYRDKINTSFG